MRAAARHLSAQGTVKRPAALHEAFRPGLQSAYRCCEFRHARGGATSVSQPWSSRLRTARPPGFSTSACMAESRFGSTRCRRWRGFGFRSLPSVASRSTWIGGEIQSVCPTRTVSGISSRQQLVRLLGKHRGRRRYPADPASKNSYLSDRILMEIRGACENCKSAKRPPSRSNVIGECVTVSTGYRLRIRSNVLSVLAVPRLRVGLGYVRRQRCWRPRNVSSTPHKGTLLKRLRTRLNIISLSRCPSIKVSRNGNVREHH